MNGAYLRRIAKRQSFGVRIKRLAELAKVGQRGAQLQIGMFAVEQQTENCLRGASVVDDLFGKEYIVETIVGDHRSGWLIVLHPFEEEYQAVDWSENMEFN